ncbi:hypothetical protein SS50377_25582 [Spironucleus salmonicida]|uniref:Uncharacterized protein n=1 Tax=Spironucleus salmonicida TaxID=348837 RepID=V6LWE0_9EUKA|nr:hypothetical protein SS50377_25582 [Spironucleus salmonicida]|eukprot:EST45129.1 Hypothetical protein SS50377_15151 [Spironucleus salmonicida]
MYQGEQEIERLQKMVQELTESKEKYKSRTKQLLSTLEGNRLSTHSDARSLAQETLTMRQLADQRDIELRKIKNQLYQKEQEIVQLQAENKQLQLSSKQKVVFDRNIEKLAEVQKRSITQAEVECQQEKEFSRVLIKTIQALLQILNVLGQQNNKIPKYAVRIFKDLQVAGDAEILPVFIDQNECSMQILLTCQNEINAPQFSKRDLYQKMYKNANMLDLKQKDQDESFVSFQAYLDKIQQDMANENDLELKKTYIIQEQQFNMQNIDFIPRKALNIIQNFTKLQRINGVTIKTSEANQLLVQLSATFHEYCQNLKSYDINQKLNKQNKEIENLNRKLLLQKPYSLVQLEEQIKRLRALCQKYKDLYENVLDKKSISKKIIVKMGDEHQVQSNNNLKFLQDEVRMLRQLVQTGGVGNATKLYDNGDQFSQQDSLQQINTQGFQYQQGCLVAGRMLMSVIEATLGTLYSMKGTNSDILEQLRKCQQRCRELLMDMLDGNVNDDIDEELE